MLEIFLLVYLSKKIGKIAESRGHKKKPNIVFFVFLWFTGELVGSMMGLLLFKGRLLPSYVLALVGAALATVVAFNIVQDLEDKNKDDTYTIDID